MSDFVPNELKKIKPNEPPWIIKPLGILLKKQKRLYKILEIHSFKLEDKARVDSFRDECKNAIAEAKKSYLINISTKLANPNTSQNSYWKLIGKVMNKCKSAKVPSIYC